MSDINTENLLKSDENVSSAEELPLVETSFRIDGTAQKMFQRKHRAGLIVATVLGAALALTYIILFTLNGETLGGKLFSVPEALLYILLICGAILLGSGLVLLIFMKKNVANVARTNAENHYRFFSDYVLIAVTQSGEAMGQVKCYYRNFVKVRENREYFMLYPTSATVYLVSKTALTEEQCGELRAVLPL